MIHLRARRLLSALPDGLLPPALERRVRSHAERCERCRAELAAFERSAGLLRRLPRSLVPLRADPEADDRLAALARWGRVPPIRSGPARSGRGRLGPIGRLAPLAATVALALLLGGGSADVPDEAGSNEAFNFVLAGSLMEGPPAGAPIVRARAFGDEAGQLGRAWIHPPTAAYLPPGAR